MNVRTIVECADAAMAELLQEPLVKLEGEYFVFRSESHPNFIYDFAPIDAADCLRWVSHMAPKLWVTTKHLEQFALLATQRFGGRS